MITAASLMVTRDPRFRLVDGYNLQVKGVRPQDAGDYNCQISDQENRDLVHTVEILGIFNIIFFFQFNLISFYYSSTSNSSKS